MQYIILSSSVYNRNHCCAGDVMSEACALCKSQVWYVISFLTNSKGLTFPINKARKEKRYLHHGFY
jgi:hypothetical protein